MSNAKKQKTITINKELYSEVEFLAKTRFADNFSLAVEYLLKIGIEKKDE